MSNKKGIAAHGIICALMILATHLAWRESARPSRGPLCQKPVDERVKDTNKRLRLLKVGAVPRMRQNSVLAAWKKAAHLSSDLAIALILRSGNDKDRESEFNQTIPDRLHRTGTHAPQTVRKSAGSRLTTSGLHC